MQKDEHPIKRSYDKQGDNKFSCRRDKTARVQRGIKLWRVNGNKMDQGWMRT